MRRRAAVARAKSDTASSVRQIKTVRLGGVDLGGVSRTQTNLLGSLARGCGIDTAEGLGIKALLESDQLANGLPVVNCGTSGHVI